MEKIRNIHKFNIVTVVNSIVGIVVQTNDGNFEFKKDFNIILNHTDYIHDFMEELYYKLAEGTFFEELENAKLELEISENEIKATFTIDGKTFDFSVRYCNNIEKLAGLINIVNDIVYELNDLITDYEFEL